MPSETSSDFFFFFFEEYKESQLWEVEHSAEKIYPISSTVVQLYQTWGDSARKSGIESGLVGLIFWCRNQTIKLNTVI